MKRLLVLVVALASFLSLGNVAVAQQAPEFQLGFKALADQLPADGVGIPVENEYFNLANGNSEQHTTKGLMVWRKADNWTAYTNGYMTWINGPAGVQSRLNAERIVWENDPTGSLVQATPVPTLAPVPTAIPSASSGSGSGYTNSNGVWVPSPGSNPAGASAQCRDGTYSYSQHRSGTCSGHGGVLRWMP